MTVTYDEKPVEKWNVNDLIRYMSDEHIKRFGCDYAPFGSWAAERGRIGKVFGTARKKGEYDKELIKRFVDRCFETYQPNAQYPGINFGFMWTYRQSDFQVVQKQYLTELKAKEDQTLSQTVADESVADWFNS